MPLITLELPALGDVASDLTFVPAFAPVRRTIAAFGGAYVSHAFPSDFPDANGASKPSSPASPTGTSTRSKGSRKKNVKLEDEDLETDWYALLELEDGEGASDEQIKAAYRKRCLDTHPDKQPDGSDVLFKRVQRGFEILGNPVARRSFDSSRPFDDSIPGEGPYKTDEAFYAAFGPAFARNSKWSAEPNMPQIGDNDTPLSDVRRMYDEWLAFHTWRDFSNEVELQEIDEGMMREERRYYQRENQRLLDKCNKEEVKRIRTMVDRAKNNDPRLRRHREAEEAARVKALEERQAARKAAEEAERRAKFEREDKEKAEKEAAKAKAVDSKMALSEMQREILKFMKEHDLIDPVHTNKLLACKVRKPNVTWVVKTANIDEALTLRQAVGDASLEVEAGAPPEGSCDEPDATEHVPAVAQFNLHLKAIEERVGRNRYGEGIKRTVGDASPAAQAAKAAAEAATKKKAAPAAGAAAWTDEDIVQLQKLAIKYPGGAVDRWRHIAHSLGGKYTEEQVLEQVKAIEKGIKSGTKPPSAVNARVPDAPVATDAVVADDWTPNQQKQLEGGLRDLKDYKEKDKFAKIAAMVDGKSAKQCHERFKYLCDMRKKSGAQ